MSSVLQKSGDIKQPQHLDTSVAAASSMSSVSRFSSNREAMFHTPDSGVDDDSDQDEIHEASNHVIEQKFTENSELEISLQEWDDRSSHVKEIVQSTLNILEESNEEANAQIDKKDFDLKDRPPTPRPSPTSFDVYSTPAFEYHSSPSSDVFKESGDIRKERNNWNEKSKAVKAKLRKQSAFLRQRFDLEQTQQDTLENLDQFCKMKSSNFISSSSSSSSASSDEEQEKPFINDIEEMGNIFYNRSKIDVVTNKSLVPMMNGVKIADPSPAKCPKAKAKTFDCSNCQFR